MAGLRQALSAHGDHRAMLRRLAVAGYLGLGAAVLAASQFLIGRFGGGMFGYVLGGILFAAVFSIISFRWLSIPFFLWILSVGGFRYIWSIQVPILPDLYLDRVTLIWLALVVMVKFSAERQAIRRPYGLDAVLFAHATYLLIQVYLQGMEAFHTWTVCILIPYAAFFMAKNIVITRSQLRTMLWVLFALSVYYNVTSVAEKLDINWLLWPKDMITNQGEFRGRSSGPFLQAPLFGTVIGMLLPLHLYFLVVVKRAGARALLIVSLLLGLAGLYFTYTRGSWLAGVTALGTTALLNRRAYLKFLMPAVVIGAILAVGVLGLAQDKFMKERVENENTVGARMGTAVTVLRVWRDYPLFGCGFFQYRHVRDRYIQPVEIPGLPTIRFVQFRHNSIHDIYLGPLAETGLVGTALQTAIYVMIFRVFWRKYRTRKKGDHFANYIMPVLGGLMVGYMVGGIAFDYRFFSVVGTYFLAAAGIVDGYRAGEHAPEA